MSSPDALSNIFSLALKMLCNIFKYLYLFERIFFQFSYFTKMIFTFPLCVFILHLIKAFFNKKLKKIVEKLLFAQSYKKI